MRRPYARCMRNLQERHRRGPGAAQEPQAGVQEGAQESPGGAQGSPKNGSQDAPRSPSEGNSTQTLFDRFGQKGGSKALSDWSKGSPEAHEHAGSVAGVGALAPSRIQKVRKSRDVPTIPPDMSSGSAVEPYGGLWSCSKMGQWVVDGRGRETRAAW